LAPASGKTIGEPSQNVDQSASERLKSTNAQSCSVSLATLPCQTHRFKNIGAADVHHTPGQFQKWRPIAAKPKNQQ